MNMLKGGYKKPAVKGDKVKKGTKGVKKANRKPASMVGVRG